MNTNEKIKVVVISDDCAAHTGFGTVVRNLFGPMDSDQRLDLKQIALYPMKEDKLRVMETIPAGGPPDDEYGIEALGGLVKADGWPDIIFLLGDYWYWNKTLLNNAWKKQNGCLSSIWYYVPFDGVQMTTICRKAYQSADKLIAMSPFGVSVLPEYAERNDVVLLPHGYNDCQFPYRKRGEGRHGPYTFGVVSRNARRKNIWAIIKAFWDLPDEVEARLLLHVAQEDRIGGNLPAWIDFSQQVAALDGKTLRPIEWTDGIKIEGNGKMSSMAGVADEDMAAIYERMDCLVSAGREGFGLPYLEARASGCRLVLPRYSAHASMTYPDTVYYDCPNTRPDPGAPDVLDICPDPARITQAMLAAMKLDAEDGVPGPLPETFSASLQWSRLSLRLHSWITAHGVSKKRIQAKEAKLFHAIPWADLRPEKLGAQKRIALVMPESTGDVLLCTGVASSLKRRFPGHALDFITKASYFGMLRGCPWIDQTVEFNPGIHPNYDKMQRLYDGYFTPFFQTQVAANWVNGGHGGKHLVEVYAAACGVEVGDFWLPQEPAKPEKRLGEAYLTFHPGSGCGQQSLRWYPRWEVVLDQIKQAHPEIKIVQVGVSDEPLVKGVDFDLRGSTAPAELNWWIGGARLHLGIDSYPTHVAGLLHTPVVALFANTRPECTGPYKPMKGEFTAITPKERPMGCMCPCHMLWCPIGQDGCIHSIDPTDVCAATLNMMRPVGMKIKYCPACGGSGSRIAVSQGVEYLGCDACHTIWAPNFDESKVRVQNDNPDGRNITANCKARRDRVIQHAGRNVEDVIDFGCGTGALVSFLRWTIQNVKGIDLDTTLQLHDLPDESQDAIFMVEVIEHLEQPDAVLREMHRILRPGGVIYIETCVTDVIKNPEEHDYVQPGIGHRTILSVRGLSLLGAGLRMSLTSINPTTFVMKKPCQS